MDCITKGLKNEIGIYKITNLNNSKCYIGQSIELEKRFRSHRNMLRTNSHSNNHLQRAYNKGDKFVFEVMELCSVEEIDEREIMWIAFFDSRNRQNGYNFDIGGSSARNKHPETIEKQRKKLIEFYSDESNRVAASIRKSKIPVETVEQIKLMLSEDLDADCPEVAKKLDVNVNSVAHIRNLNSHTYILENLNYIIYNRDIISHKRKDKTIIRMYRDGYSYSQIGEVVNLHHRNVIRRVIKLKNIHDDRCRLNSINKSIMKRNSLIMTLHKMGKNTVEIPKMIKVSRGIVSEVLKGEVRTFKEVSETRGRFFLEYR